MSLVALTLARMADAEPLSLQDLLEAARKRASTFAASPAAQDARQIATAVLGLGRDAENWTALATAVDELVEVVLFQQRLIEELLGAPGAPDYRFSRLVEQARAARTGGPVVPKQAPAFHA